MMFQSWIVTLDVLKLIRQLSIRDRQRGWIVTLDVLKLVTPHFLYAVMFGWIVTLDVLKLERTNDDVSDLVLNSNIRCIEMI